MKSLFLVMVCLGFGLAGCWQPTHSKTSAVVDGVYCSVACLSLELIELKNGGLRYWFRSDVVGGVEPDYPLQGTYIVKGDVVTLQHGEIYETKRRRVFRVVNGKPSLWFTEAWEQWQRTKHFDLINTYVAFRVDDPPEMIWKKWPWEWRKWKEFRP